MTGAAMSLEGKRVVVIGGASGIGFAVAAVAKEIGAEVVIASRNAEKVAAAVARLPGATGDTVDLRDESSVAGFFETLGAFDHLAVTAGDWGGARHVAMKDLDLVAGRESLETRFWGLLAAVKFGSRTIDPNGSITMTSGFMAHRPRKGAPLATAIAGAVEHLARGLAVDLAPVRVNAVCPGMILTEIVGQVPEETLRTWQAGLPLQRGATPNEAATAYVYLMLNGSATGQIVPVEGGGLLVYGSSQYPKGWGPGGDANLRADLR
jgi:NAD(P)-dependent dehydrogenase (short-subunit alcohol dehydrogenase family)